MSAIIIDGRKVSSDIKKELQTEIDELKKKNIIPGLAVILVGDDEASKVYVRNKQRFCEEIGIHSERYEFPSDVSEDKILDLIKELNVRNDIDGILVQLPLPEQLDENKIINLISPLKDVDAFHPISVGNISIGHRGFLPCTPQGVMELLKSEGIDVFGKECVVVGSSNIVGKPMAMLLLNENATVSICNKYTKDLKSYCKSADIVIVAAGCPKLITADMIKPGAVVIDVGINRDESGKLCGDVDFENVKEKAGYITPVPGGVGPMTVAMLMKNTVYSAKENRL